MNIKKSIILLTLLLTSLNILAHSSFLDDEVYEKLQDECGMADVNYFDISNEVLDTKFIGDENDWVLGFESEVAYLYKDELVAIAYIMGVTAEDEGDIVDEAYFDEFTCPNK